MNHLISIELEREVAEHILHCLTGSNEQLNSIDPSAIIEFSVAVQDAILMDDTEADSELTEVFSK